MIIAFPRDRCRASSGKISGGRCKIIILPVIRIERWPEKPKRSRNRKPKRKTP